MARDRKDAKRVQLPGLMQCCIDLKPRRMENEVYINRMMDVTPLTEFIEQKKAEGTRYTYFQAFITAQQMRQSCYRCLYARSERVSDVTVGDFWNVSILFQAQHHAEKGCSLLLINTAKGAAFVQSCDSELVRHLRSWRESRKNHPLWRPVRPSARMSRGFAFRTVRFVFFRLPCRLWLSLLRHVLKWQNMLALGRRGEM